MALELTQVFQVGHAVVGLKEFEILTGREILALLAAVELLFSGTVPDLAVGRAAVAPAGPLAAQLHHRAHKAVALVVVLEFLEVVPMDIGIRHHFRHLVEAVTPELLSQVSGQIRHRLRMTDAIPTVQPAIADQLLLVRHATLLHNLDVHSLQS